MHISAISNATSILPTQTVDPSSIGDEQEIANEITFSDIFRSALHKSADLDAEAARKVTGLLSGDGIEVHEAMIATQKAEIAFEIVLQVRNKAVAAYQQMMQMQF